MSQIDTWLWLIFMDGSNHNKKKMNCLKLPMRRRVTAMLFTELWTWYKTAKQELLTVFKAMLTIVHNSPARQDIYIQESPSQVFPFRFWQTRWVEKADIKPSLTVIYNMWKNEMKAYPLINLVILVLHNVLPFGKWNGSTPRSSFTFGFISTEVSTI